MHVLPPGLRLIEAELAFKPTALPVMLPIVVESTVYDPTGPCSNCHRVPRGLKGGENGESSPAIVQQSADSCPRNSLVCQE